MTFTHVHGCSTGVQSGDERRGAVRVPGGPFTEGYLTTVLSKPVIYQKARHSLNKSSQECQETGQISGPGQKVRSQGQGRKSDLRVRKSDLRVRMSDLRVSLALGPV